MADRAGFLERKQLLSTERFIVDLRSGLDQVLQVRAGEEVAEIDEFAVVLVLDCTLCQYHCKGDSNQRSSYSFKDR